MPSRWVCGCLLIAMSSLSGCGRVPPLPPAAVPTPGPAIASVPAVSVVAPVTQEVTSDGPRVRVHLTMVAIQGRGPFPKELPNLWSTTETSQVFPTEEIKAAVAAAEKTGMARRRAWDDPEVASGQTWDWDLRGSVVGGVTVTPTMGSDGLIQFSFVAHQDQPNTEQTAPNETKIDLRENETIAIAGPTAHGICLEISRVPIVGDIPVIGRLFTSRKTVKESNKTMFLLSWETIPQ